MVKKIRLVEDEKDDVPASESATSTFDDTKWYELAKSMDWKLWEMLQTVQRLEKQLGNTITKEETDEKTEK